MHATKAILSLRPSPLGNSHLRLPSVSLGGRHREDTPTVKIGIQVARGRLFRAIAIRPEPLHSFPWASEKRATCWRRTTDPPSLPTYHGNRCHTTSIERTGDLPPPLFQEVCALALAHTAMHCLYLPLAANTKKSLDSGLGQPHTHSLSHIQPPGTQRLNASMPDPAETRVEDLNHVLGADTVIPDLERSEMSIPLSRVSLLVLTRDKLPVRLSAPGEVTQDTVSCGGSQAPYLLQGHIIHQALPFHISEPLPCHSGEGLHTTQPCYQVPTCMFNWGPSITSAELLLQCPSWLDRAQDVAILFLVCHGCLSTLPRSVLPGGDRIAVFLPWGSMPIESPTWHLCGYYGRCLGSWDPCVTLVLES